MIRDRELSSQYDQPQKNELYSDNQRSQKNYSIQLGGNEFDRQEQLRKQILFKEKQLSIMKNNTEQLKQRLAQLPITSQKRTSLQQQDTEQLIQHSRKQSQEMSRNNEMFQQQNYNNDQAAVNLNKFDQQIQIQPASSTSMLQSKFANGSINDLTQAHPLDIFGRINESPSDKQGSRFQTIQVQSSDNYSSNQRSPKSFIQNVNNSQYQENKNNQQLRDRNISNKQSQKEQQQEQNQQTSQSQYMPPQFGDQRHNFSRQISPYKQEFSATLGQRGNIISTKANSSLLKNDFSQNPSQIPSANQTIENKFILPEKGPSSFDNKNVTSNPYRYSKPPSYNHRRDANNINRKEEFMNNYEKESKNQDQQIIGNYHSLKKPKIDQSSIDNKNIHRKNETGIHSMQHSWQKNSDLQYQDLQSYQRNESSNPRSNSSMHQQIQLDNNKNYKIIDQFDNRSFSLGRKTSNDFEIRQIHLNNTLDGQPNQNYRQLRNLSIGSQQSHGKNSQSPLRIKMQSPARPSEFLQIHQENMLQIPEIQKFQQLQIEINSMERRLEIIQREKDRTKIENENLSQQLQRAILLNGEHELQIQIMQQNNLGTVVSQDFQLIQEANSFIKNNIQMNCNEIKNIHDQQQNNIQVIQQNDHQSQILKQDIEFRILDQEKLIRLDVDVNIQISQTKLACTEEEHVLALLENENKDLMNEVQYSLQQKQEIFIDLDQQAEKTDQRMNYLRNSQFNLIRNNIVQNQILATKIINQTIVILKFNQLKRSFKEIVLYANFDQKCRKSLRILAKIFMKLGIFLKQKYLKKWYTSLLKPIPTIEQNYQISQKIRNLNLIKKSFQCMYRETQNKIFKQENQQKSIKIIQYISNKNLINLELKFTFQRWKYTQEQNKKINKMLTRLLQQKYLRILQHHFKILNDFQQNLMNQCRMELLKRQFSNDLFKQLIFSRQQYKTREKKNSNKIITGRIFKAFQKSIEISKFQKQKSDLVLQLYAQKMLNQVQACLQALKHNKEINKHKILRDQIQQIVDVNIQNTHSNIKQLGNELVLKHKQQSLNIICLMLNRQTFCYFKQWRLFVFNHRLKISSNLKQRVIKRYNHVMMSYFSGWKEQMQHKKKRVRNKIIQNLEQDGQIIKDDQIEIKKQIDADVEAVRSGQRKNLIKVTKSLAERLYRDGFILWARFMMIQREKEEKAEFILLKIRKQIVARSFKKYKQIILFTKRTEHQSSRSQYLNQLFKTRLTIKIVKSWIQFNENFKNQKSYLKRMFTRLLRAKMIRQMQKWSEGVNYKKQEQLKNSQNQVAQTIDVKNQVLGALQNITDKQTIEANKFDEWKKELSRKILINYYIRFYTNSCTKAFRTWKFDCNMKQRRDGIVYRKIFQSRRQMFQLTVSALKLVQNKSRMKDLLQLLKQQQILSLEQEQLIQFNIEESQKLNSQISSQLDFSTPQKLGQIDTSKSRIEKTFQILTRRNQDNLIQSKKRSIFEGWRKIGKVQRRFCTNISKVCTKSMYAFAFSQILLKQQQTSGIFKLKYLLKRFVVTIQKKSLQNIMSIWKRQAFKEVQSVEGDVNNQYNELLQSVQNKFNIIKDHNLNNVLNYFRKKKRLIVWKAWLKQRYDLYVREKQNEMAEEKLSYHYRKRGLQKWFFRVKLTRRLRFKSCSLDYNYNKRMKRTIFECLQVKKKINNQMAWSVSQLEKFMRAKIMKDAFKDLTSFYLSKKLATGVLKKRSTLDSVSLLTQRNVLVLRKYFYRYKCSLNEKDYRKRRLIAIYANQRAQKAHKGMRRWLAYTEKNMQAQELNEVGPITEHVFEAQRLKKNLQDFLRDEGYPEEIVKKLSQDAHDRQINRIQMGVLRYRISQAQFGKLKIKAFDHWKMMIAFRKLMRHWLVVCNNRVQWVKADMHFAFNKWRQSDATQSGALEKKPRQWLKNKNLKQSMDLINLASKEAVGDNQLRHLALQRDELLEHYIRGQKLALSSCHCSHIRALGKAFAVWRSLLTTALYEDGQEKIVDKIDQLTAIKNKVREIEKENLELANENAELRKFSMDGFKIAQSITSLSAERELLTVDLADQADMIKVLLEKNKNLQKSLDQVMGIQGSKSNKENLNNSFNKKDSNQIHSSIKQRQKY